MIDNQLANVGGLACVLDIDTNERPIARVIKNHPYFNLLRVNCR